MSLEPIKLRWQCKLDNDKQDWNIEWYCADNASLFTFTQEKEFKDQLDRFFRDERQYLVDVQVTCNRDTMALIVEFAGFYINDITDGRKKLDEAAKNADNKASNR